LDPATVRPAPPPALRPLVRPLQEFLSTEAASGALLLAAALAALVWANWPGSHSYEEFWGAHVDLNLNLVRLDLSLQQWVNDGLMAVFFFVVGLEIKRELLKGELAEPRKAALPVTAALGGMIVPALVYLAFNAGREGEHGWGIPMATDIAFAVGVLALLGPRVPVALKVFLLALAIADDLGAIAVIAIFYSDHIEPGWLDAAVGLLIATGVLGQLGVRSLLVYVAAGLAAWLAVHESGVHATVAGVALGLLTPASAYFGKGAVEARIADLAADLRRGEAEGTPAGDELGGAALRDLEELSRESQPVLDRIEHALHPWTSFAIVPVFALANAGVELGGGAVRDAASSPISAGVALGLIAGKPAGILLFSFAAVRAGIGSLPEGVRWPMLAGAAMIAGIGFTVSLFISDLAFDGAQQIADAKIGILAGSLVIGAAGYAALRLVTGAAAARA